MNIDAEQPSRHFREFVQNFLLPWRQHRWLQLLDTDPDRWDMVGADELWKAGYATGGRVRRYSDSITQLLRTEKLEKYLDHDVFVFRLGHDDYPGVTKIRLAELEMEDPLEAIVSIIPGKLALALGHGGEVAILE